MGKKYLLRRGTGLLDTQKGGFRLRAPPSSKALAHGTLLRSATTARRLFPSATWVMACGEPAERLGP